MCIANTSLSPFHLLVYLVEYHRTRNGSHLRLPADLQAALARLLAGRLAGFGHAQRARSRQHHRRARLVTQWLWRCQVGVQSIRRRQQLG